MKQITLTQGKFTLVDDEDFEYLNQWKWSFHSAGYASHGKWNPQKGQMETILMHRVLLNPSKEFGVDHISGNKLDNQKANLRLCTQRLNVRNKKTRCDSASQCKGVYYKRSGKRIKRWMARIQVDNKSHYLGYFLTKQEAVESYNAGAKTYFGEYAYLNIINP